MSATECLGLLPTTITDARAARMAKTLRGRHEKFRKGRMTFKFVGREYGEACMDCDDFGGDWRSREKSKTALLKCLECSETMLADYISGGSCGQHRGRGIRLMDMARPVQEGYDLTCPFCGAVVRLVHEGSMKNEYDTARVIEPMVRGGRAVFCEWDVTRHWHFGFEEWDWTPISAVALDGRTLRRFEWKDRTYWRAVKTFADRWGQMAVCTVDPPCLDGTALENAKLWEAAEAAGSMFYLLAYIRLYLRRPQVENLITSGLAHVVFGEIRRCCEGTGTFGERRIYSPADKIGWIDWAAAKPHRMLHMTRDQLRRAKREHWGSEDHRIWADYGGKGRLTFEGLSEALRIKIMGAVSIRSCLDAGCDPAKVSRYLQGQDRAWTYLEDYWRMARQAEMNLDDPSVRWPRHLREAHDRAREAARYHENDQYREKFAEMSRRCKGLAWAHDGICIRVAETPEELVREGDVLHHCVGGYADKHCRGQIILFIRHARRPERSWFTLNVDVRSKQIIQNHGYGNEWAHGHKLHIPREVTEFVAMWEREVLRPWKLPAPQKETKVRQRIRVPA